MNWKMYGRVFGLVLLSVNFIAANASYSIGPAQAGAGDPIITTQTRATAITAAEEQARTHLGSFLDYALDENGIARDNAAIKIVMSGYGGDDDVVWVSPFAMRDGRYVGILANEPKQPKPSTSAIPWRLTPHRCVTGISLATTEKCTAATPPE